MLGRGHPQSKDVVANFSVCFLHKSLLISCVCYITHIIHNGPHCTTLKAVNMPHLRAPSEITVSHSPAQALRNKKQVQLNFSTSSASPQSSPTKGKKPTPTAAQRFPTRSQKNLRRAPHRPRAARHGANGRAATELLLCALRCAAAAARAPVPAPPHVVPSALAARTPAVQRPAPRYFASHPHPCERPPLCERQGMAGAQRDGRAARRCRRGSSLIACAAVANDGAAHGFRTQAQKSIDLALSQHASPAGWPTKRRARGD